MGLGCPRYAPRVAAAKKPPPTHVAHLLLGVLGVVPPELHPQPPVHGGGPQPKVGAYGYVVGGLWLADRARPHVDPRDREVFEQWVTLAREQLAAGPADDTRRKDLMKADAKKASRIPCKIGIWSAHEASNWAWRSIYAGGAARPAFANWGRYLLRKSPADVRAFVVDVHALCIHLEALSLLREREQQTSAPVVATPWRGHEDGRASQFVMRLADGRFALLGKLGGRWQLVEGPRDEVLASVPDALFAQAVRAVVPEQAG